MTIDPKIMRPGEYEIAKQDELAQAALAEEVSPGKPVVEKKEEDKRTPAEKWLDNIKLVDLTEVQADEILTKLLEQGYYEREYALFRGRLKITLRTRNSYSNQRVAAAIDGLRTADQQVYNQVMLRQQLAGSLVKYQGQSMKRAVSTEANDIHDAAHQSTLDFIDKVIPEHVVSTLYQQLVKFDTLVRAVLSEGATEGF